MSNVKLTLRPPPNVDFVHGYPGIPPGQDRQQAAVKGAIEVRTPVQGVKAQWVRIELRKVETLPGGGDSNTFYDYVGPSPVTLWNAPDEYNILRTQDFPFSIRIPESIPPTIALENRAGIQYELVATVCTKGKKGFLRKRKNIVTKEVSSVIIDKHELHSTWPVYCQPEKRQLSQEGVTLMVERGHTCYGPGDRISVTATLKSDSIHTVILRGFEMTLKESTIFRAHPFGTARKVAPLTRLVNVAETKLAINATLYGGTLHQAELACQLPPNHTTTTLNAARHIDVTYVLSVKALMGTGTQITMDLPVVVSNWQRYVSQEAIRRIGVAPALSLVPPSSTMMSIEPSSPTRPQQPIVTSTAPPPTTHVVTSSNSQFPPAPTTQARPDTATATDDFGYGAGYGKTTRPRQNSDAKGYQNDTTATATATTTTAAARPSVTASTIAPSTRRPNSARAANAANRFTITNAEPELPDDAPTNIINAAPVVGPTRTASVQPSPKVWPTAEEEKRAYELARSKVERVQGPAATSSPVSAPAASATKNTSTPAGKRWLSAEEEKVLLSEKAQTANKSQQHSGTGGTTTSNNVSGSAGHRPTPSELYQQAMANVNANANRNQPPQNHISPLSGVSRKTTANAPKIPQYLTAEQEKAALKRYEEARSAVNQLQNHGYSDSTGQGPIAYDSLYPKTGGSSSAVDPPPPSFEASVSPSVAAVAGPMSAAAEKAALAEKIKAADAQRQFDHFDPPPPSFNTVTSPTPTTTTTSGPSSTQKQYMDAAAEKEALRKKLEARDAAALAKKKSGSGRSAIPPRSASLASNNTRPTPTPPTSNVVGSTTVPDSNAVLTAAEEKAMIRAKLDAKDAKAQRKVNGHNGTPPSSVMGSPKSANTTPPPLTPQSFQQQQHQHSMMGSDSPSPLSKPPPLMPRPPAEYIQETQEEDARVSRFTIDSPNLRIDMDGDDGFSGRSSGVGVGVGVYVNGNGNGHGHGQSGKLMAPGPPPPLPPKPAGE